MILDSGNRTEFETGAVRDMQDGKGYPCLIPLDVLAFWMHDNIMEALSRLQDAVMYQDGDVLPIADAVDKVQIKFVHKAYKDYADAVIALGVHFFNGERKYTRDNWKKGIPLESYLNSAIRHYVKWWCNWTDEDHAAAFLWNLMCLQWTAENLGGDTDV